MDRFLERVSQGGKVMMWLKIIVVCLLLDIIWAAIVYFLKLEPYMVWGCVGGILIGVIVMLQFWEVIL